MFFSPPCARARSLIVWYCSWGRRNDLVTFLIEIAAGAELRTGLGCAERSVLTIALTREKVAIGLVPGDRGSEPPCARC